MRSLGIGDLAASYQTSLSTNRLKTDIARLSQELSTGERADLKSGTGADLSKYSGIRTTLTRLTAYSFAAQDAALLTESAQSSLANIQSFTEELGLDLIDAGNGATEPSMTILARSARGQLDSVIASLNLQVGDRYLFAGAAVDTAPVASAETILAELGLAIAGLTTAADIETAVNDWFDLPGGGFETNGYLGSTTDLAAFNVGQNEQVSLGLRADDQVFRDTLKGYAMAALVSEGTLAGDEAQRAQLLATAGERILQSNYDIVEVRGTLGVAEETIANSQARNAAEILSLQLAETKIVQADPFTSATQLQAAETQLETLYAVTARLSNLSLVDYIR